MSFIIHLMHVDTKFQNSEHKICFLFWKYFFVVINLRAKFKFKQINDTHKIISQYFRNFKILKCLMLTLLTTIFTILCWSILTHNRRSKTNSVETFTRSQLEAKRQTNSMRYATDQNKRTLWMDPRKNRNTFRGPFGQNLKLIILNKFKMQTI